MGSKKFPTLKERREKFERTSTEAAAALEKERAERMAKTAKLREARLAAQKGGKPTSRE